MVERVRRMFDLRPRHGAIYSLGITTGQHGINELAEELLIVRHDSIKWCQPLFTERCAT